MPTPGKGASDTFWSEDVSGAMFGLHVRDSRAYRLVVEAAGAVWEWIAWPVGESSLARCGRADTREKAMQQADAAIRWMEPGKA